MPRTKTDSEVSNQYTLDGIVGTRLAKANTALASSPRSHSLLALSDTDSVHSREVVVVILGVEVTFPLLFDDVMVCPLAVGPVSETVGRSDALDERLLVGATDSVGEGAMVPVLVGVT